MWTRSDPLPFSTRLLLIFALPLGIWVLVSLVGVVMLQRALVSYENSQRVQEILELANTFRSAPETLRNHERLFLLTSSREHLDARQQALERANETYANLLNTVRGDPMQQRRLALAGERLQEWVYDVSNKRIQMRADVGSPDQQPDLRKAPLLIAEFLRAMNEFIAAEEEILETYRAEVDVAADAIELTIFSGLVLGAASMILVIFWITVRIGRSVKSINVAAEELAKGNMGARIEEGGSELARRFNVMAELVERRNNELTVLADLGEFLNSCSNVNEAKTVFNEFAARLFPDKPGTLYLVESNRKDARAITVWGDGRDYCESYMTFDDCWALRLGRPHVSAPDGGNRCRHLHESRHSVRCTPLPAFGEIIGVLSVVNDHVPEKGRGKLFSDTVAQQVALAFANVRLREMLRHQAIRDPLTHLYNRRHLDQALQMEIYRAKRHQQPLSAILFDIDYFKNFNDSYGHDGGDAVLKCVGETLQDFFRPEDSAFRAGGEEFIVLLPGTSKHDALERASALRERIAELSIIHGNVSLPSVTVSLGVATHPEDGRDGGALLKAADKAMYQAKQAGRNRVVAAGDWPAP